MHSLRSTFRLNPPPLLKARNRNKSGVCVCVCVWWVCVSVGVCVCVCVCVCCTQTGKRHGRSSGMRHGLRSSWSGVRTPVRPSVQGPVGEAPATAPFSIPLHHRYRRCDGWRVSSIFPNPPTPTPPTPQRLDPHTKKTKHQAQRTCSSALRHCYRRPPGGARPPHIPLPLARGRGLEPGSSRRGSAAQPLRHAAQNPAKVWFLYPCFLPASPSMNVSLVCLQ